MTNTCVGVCARWLAGALFLAAGASTRAGSPSLTVVHPRGGQRGSEIVVNLHGARLTEPRQVLFYRSGISLKGFEPVNAGHVRATFAIAADCEPGLHPLRLVTASGISELRLFSVGACAEVVEQESNNDRSKPQAITPPVTVNGTITSEDIDYFAFEAAAGQRINIEIEAMRLADTVFDPHISLLDSRGAVLANADDTPLVRQDAVISHVFEQADTYTIAVREASYRGSGNSYYRLHVGGFPRPRGVFPPGGQPGQTLEVRWLGDGKAAPETITLPSETRIGFGLFPAGEAGSAPSPVPFRLSPLPQTIEVEPNNEQANATPIEVPGAAAGVLAAPGDVDWYRFTGAKGQQLEARVYGRALRSPIDSVIGVAKLGSPAAAHNDDAGGPDSSLRFGVETDQEVGLYIRDLLNRGGELYAYRLEIAPVTPRLTLSTLRELQVIAASQGNRSAILVNASRRDFSGPLVLELPELPAGLMAHVPPMPANVSAVPIVLEARSDAPLAAALVPLRGRHADASQQIEGGLLQELRLTEYMNRTMTAQTVDRLPVAVTQPAPFAVQIVGPHVPLVRHGAISVAVEATRADGFAQPIQLRVLWNPPGVGAGGGVIPSDQTRAALHLNANPNAALGDWPLVVIAWANVAGGPVVVSSQVATLTVAQPYKTMQVQQARITQGQAADMIVTLESRESFPGEARVELRGLPRGVSAAPLGMTSETGALTFKLTATADAHVGRHNGIHALAEVALDSGSVQFRSADQTLFVDRPLPVAKNAPPPPPPKAGDEKQKRVRTPRRPEFLPPRGGSE